MNEKIIQMARDAGYMNREVWGQIDYLERFAAVIRAATKEEDAKICEKLSSQWPIDNNHFDVAAKSIRASK